MRIFVGVLSRGAETRMPIKIVLRNGPSQIARLEVVDVQTGAPEQGYPMCVPLQNGERDVRESMHKALNAAHGDGVRGVIEDKMLVLEVTSPFVPNLDLIDLPGVRTASKVNEAPDLPETTRRVVDKFVDKLAKENGGQNTYYILVVDASERDPRGMGLLQDWEKDANKKPWLRTVRKNTVCAYTVRGASEHNRCDATL
jgi:hypothetical protein